MHFIQLGKKMTDTESIEEYVRYADHSKQQKRNHKKLKRNC